MPLFSSRLLRLLLLAVPLLALGCGDAEDEPIAPGVPQVLAEQRAARITDLAVDVTFVIPEAADSAITGSVTSTFTYAAPGQRSGPLVFDFQATPDQVHAVLINGDTVRAEVRDEHVVLPSGILRDSVNTVTIDFTAGDDALNRRDDYLYTLFVPDRARTAFPTFDQPDLKARYRLTLHLPAAWTALANAPVATADTSGGRAVVRFRETPPLPTYLFAFAAGAFETIEAEREGRTMIMLHRETDTDKLDRNTDALFDLHAASLAWLEDYTGIPYPFEQFGFVLIPSFQFGGMEHPGAILYRVSSLLLDESATQAQRLGRASLIAHETAHMWFGDLVTMRWFDDVWMKEVFANFMAAKIVNPSFPEINHDLRFLLAHYPSAYGVDRTAGTHPIRQPLGNLNDAGSLYGAIIYQKAPIVMRQLEDLLGEAAFREGLQEYLDRYAFDNATWPDLIEILDARTDLDLATWSRRWVSEPGRPVIRTERYTPTNDTLPAIRLLQEAPDSRLWTQTLTLTYGGADAIQTDTVLLDTQDVSVPLGVAAPDIVLVHGYGLLQPDDATYRYLLRYLPAIADDEARAVAWLTLWDALLERRAPPDALARLLLRALPDEPTELLAQRMLNDLETLYWRYLYTMPPPRRQTETIEATLWEAVQAAASPSRKAAFFNTYRDIASTPEALDRLERLWRGDLTVEGLSLSETDRTNLALVLALHDVEGWQEIMDTQQAAISNPERAERFAFLRPAVHPDVAVRDSVFASFAEEANRQRENWVLDAVRYLNHPRHADHAVRYLEPGLSKLRELQQTGTIFFPRRFLDALFSGHTSPEAASAIRGFLDEADAYPMRLRGKILQAADPVFRAAAF